MNYKCFLGVIIMVFIPFFSSSLTISFKKKSEHGGPFPRRGCVCVSEPWMLTTGPMQSFLATSDIAQRWHLYQIQPSGVNIHFVHCLKFFLIHCQYLKLWRFHMRKQSSGFSFKKSETVWSLMTGYIGSNSSMTVCQGWGWLSLF